MKSPRTPLQWTVRLGLVLATMLLILLLGDHMLHAGPDVTSRMELAKVAQALNRSVPVMFDDDAQLTAVFALEGMLVYDVRLVNDSRAELDAQALHDSARAFVTNRACTVPQTREDLLNRGVVLRYSYHDRGGEFITLVDVTRDDCARSGN